MVKGVSFTTYYCYFLSGDFAQNCRTEEKYVRVENVYSLRPFECNEPWFLLFGGSFLLRVC